MGNPEPSPNIYPCKGYMMDAVQRVEGGWSGNNSRLKVYSSPWRKSG